jgi:hypothetical protein
MDTVCTHGQRQRATAADRQTALPMRLSLRRCMCVCSCAAACVCRCGAACVCSCAATCVCRCATVCVYRCLSPCACVCVAGWLSGWLSVYPVRAALCIYVSLCLCLCAQIEAQSREPLAGHRAALRPRLGGLVGSTVVVPGKTACSSHARCVVLALRSPHCEPAPAAAHQGEGG